jgi:hypothetical protein
MKTSVVHVTLSDVFQRNGRLLEPLDSSIQVGHGQNLYLSCGMSVCAAVPFVVTVITAAIKRYTGAQGRDKRDI